MEFKFDWNYPGALEYFGIKFQSLYFCWCNYILEINGSWVPSWENLFVVELNYSPRDWYICQYYLEVVNGLCRGCWAFFEE